MIVSHEKMSVHTLYLCFFEIIDGNYYNNQTNLENSKVTVNNLAGRGSLWSTSVNRINTFFNKLGHFT